MAMSAIYVVDIVLLVILYLLIMFMCGYSVFCVYRLLQNLQSRILLRPTRVVFSHKRDGSSTEELRTVVAYQNPLTGEYCVNKNLSRSARALSSPDSGLSDAYEPLRPCGELHRVQGDGIQMDMPTPHTYSQTKVVLNDNGLNKTWNWNYKEYQI